MLAACTTSTPAPTVTASPTTTPRPTSTPGPTPTPIPTLAATPAASDFDQQAQALRPEFAADLAGMSEVTRYWIELLIEFVPEEQRADLSGTARLRYTNGEDMPLDDIVLMLWPNHDQYRGAMSAGAALIEGTLVSPTSEMGGLARRYQLPQPLPAGDSLDLSVEFRVQTTGSIGFGLPYRFGVTQGVLFAPTFYPLVPRRIDGQWELEPAPLSGDTTNSEVALYEVRVSFDPQYTLVATGVEVDREDNGSDRATATLVSGPARDFSLALGDFISRSETVDGTTIAGWVLEQHESDLADMVDEAAKQVALLGELVGPYPYTELDVVDVPGAFGGIEYPALVSIGTLGGPNVLNPTVHEVGHQWFYGLIGDDQLLEPWLDEAAATYTQVLYQEQYFGSGTATGMLTDLRRQLRGHPNPERPIGQPVSAYNSGGDYGLFVYVKGALFFDALRAEMGDELFFGFLQSYFDQYRYQIASAADFQAAAEQTCACDLDRLFQLWVRIGGPIPGL